MIKHVGALVAITVFVFGTIFLLTSDWPFGGPAEEAPTAGEAAMPAAESPMPEGEAASAEEVAATPAEEAAETAPAEDEAAAAQAQPAAAEAEATEEPAAPDAEPAAQEGAAEDASAEEAAAAPAQEAQSAPAEETAAAGTDVAALAAEGQGTYEQACQACHGAQGEGAIGPAFAENANLEDAGYVAATIIEGRGAMPPFGDQLDDAQIAAVATFIRNSWGNAFGPVTTDEVAAER